MFDSHFVFSNCSLPDCVHLFSRSVKLSAILLIGSCDRLCQITWWWWWWWCYAIY